MIMAGRSNLECTILGMLIQLSMANRASPLYLFCLCRVYSNALEFKKGEYIVTFQLTILMYAQEMDLNWPYAQKRQQQWDKTRLKLSTIVKEEGWTAKEQLEAVHAAGVEEWATPGRGPRHQLAETNVHWMVLLEDALCSLNGRRGSMIIIMIIFKTIGSRKSLKFALPVVP